MTQVRFEGFLSGLAATPNGPSLVRLDLLAWIQYRRGGITAALAASNRSQRWGRPNPTMLYHRSRILAAIGRRAEAGRLLSEATALPTLLAPHARRDWAV